MLRVFSRVVRCLLLAGLALAAGWSGAQPAGERRVALLIGNANYPRAPLANAVNDVRLMEATLKEVGFEVIKAENAGRRDMQRLIREFGDRLRQSGGVGLFYFAGHGVQVRGNNYLIPVDADIRAEDEVAFDSIDAQAVLEKMETARNRVNLVILDACRDNPFARTRSMAAGLATMNAPSGSLVAYATAPGSVASDGDGSNGLYTQHLAAAMRMPGLPVEEVFKQVRTAVRRASQGQQTPWENTALEGQFFFRAPAPVAPEGAAMQSAAVERLVAERLAAERAAMERAAAERPAAQPLAAAQARPPAAAPPAAAPPAEAPAARAPAGRGVLVVRDRLTGQEREIAVEPQKAPDGSTRWTSGDHVGADGRARAVRLGNNVASVQSGSLWRFPLRAGSSGSASVIVDQQYPGTLTWKVVADGADSAIEGRLEYDLTGSSSQGMRKGTWSATFRGPAQVPSGFKVEMRGYLGGSDLTAGELREAAAR